MAKIISTSCIVCQNRSDIFNSLGPEELEAVNCQRISVHYNAGEVIFKQGTPCYYFVCITSGLVKLYLENENSHNIIIGLARPVDYIFMPGAYVNYRHQFTAVACEDTTACLIESDIWHDLIKTNPNFANDFIRKMSLQSIELIDKISSITQKQVFGRMADVLIYLSKNIYFQDSFTLTLSRQDLADFSGMTKESAIRAMKKFKEDQIISLKGNNIEILNPFLLETISKNG
ncbi:MAG: Crp/Fnr family transcriptional regulator [Bacteroidales bacterium]|nr:Crp/Fnr family transcriptional regulator [Bacteroidales bacterium]MDZ4205204.1 Crp/Fnr family transcriptional regulator [Bacteroidales bacterium]